jgi:hypothetical protein
LLRLGKYNGRCTAQWGPRRARESLNDRGNPVVVVEAFLALLRVAVQVENRSYLKKNVRIVPAVN